MMSTGAATRDPGRTRAPAPPAAAQPPIAGFPTSLRRFFAQSLPSILVVCLIGGLISAFFLALYRRLPMPVGWDTARYLDQTNLDSIHGIAGGAHVVIPRPSQVLASRVGFPVTVLSLSRLLHTSTFTLAATVPIAALVATALAAGALITYTLRRGPFDLAVVAAVVGTSSALVRLMAGTYTDNLLAAALLVALLVPVVSVARGGSGLIGAIVLLAVGGLIHPSFFAVMAATLGLVAVFYLPGSWRAWRSGERPLLGTTSARLGMVLGGGAGLTAVGILGILGSTPDTPLLSHKLFLSKLREDVPLYWFPGTVPLAALGGGVLAVEERRAASASTSRLDRFTTKFLLVLLAAWVLVAAVGITGFLLGRALPAHRFLAFLLAFPILMALGILGLAGWMASRSGGAVRYVRVAVAMVAVIGLGALGFHNLYRTLAHRGLEWLDRGKVTDAVSAGGYLTAMRIPLDQPVVFLLTDTGPQPQSVIPLEAHVLRSALPADRIEHAYFYVGTVDNYLAGKPTLIPGDRRHFNVVSSRFWASVRTIYASNPVVLLPGSYNPDFAPTLAAHPDWVVAPNVIAVTGPRPAKLILTPAVPSAPKGPIRAGFWGILTLVTLVLIGVGWAIALLPPGLRPFEVLSLSASFGIAVLVLAGTLMDGVGVSLAGVGGALTGPGVGLIGWALAALRIRRHGLALLAA